jgi:uncharacterized delta-60 repeat protein
MLSIATSAGRTALAPDSTVHLRIHVEGADDDASVEVQNLPAGLSMLFDPPVIHGAGDTDLAISAARGAIAGVYTVVLRATDRSHSASTGLEIAVDVKDDFSVVVVPSVIALRPGESAGVAVSVARRGAFEGPIEVSVLDSSGDLSAPAFAIPAGATSGILQLSARPTAGRADRALVVRAAEPGLGERIAPLAVHLQPASGALDGSFGENGTARFLPYGYSMGNGAAVQADGKVLVALSLGGFNLPTRSALARLLPDGSLDTSFGTGGMVTIAITNTVAESYPRDVTVASDGAIYVAVSGAGGPAGLVARVTSSGMLDTTFGEAGLARRAAVAPYGVRILNGRVLVAGPSPTLAAPLSWEVAALDSKGALDPTFGTGGATTVLVGDDRARFELVGAKPMLTGTTAPEAPTSDISLVRLGATGMLDGSFGASGLVTVDFAKHEERGVALAGQADGKTVVVAQERPGDSGYQTTRTVLTRVLPSGALDPGFGTGGRVVMAASNEFPHSVAIQADGRIVITATVDVDKFGVSRVMADGRLDATFGVAGRVVLPGNDASRAFVLADGRLLFVRYLTSGVALTRMWP